MASAAIAAGGSILSGVLSGKGASAAAKAQAQAENNALGLQRDEFNTTQANEQPYITAGNNALTSVESLLGMNGDGYQQGIITNIQNQPGYTDTFNQGKDAILQSAAATGGLRGGDVNTSLATFGSNLLTQAIQQRLAALTGLVNGGQNAASGLASSAQNYANSSSGLLAQQGNANATSAAAPYGAAVGTIGNLSSLLGANFGGGSLTAPTLGNTGLNSSFGAGSLGW